MHARSVPWLTDMKGTPSYWIVGSICLTKELLLISHLDTMYKIILPKIDGLGSKCLPPPPPPPPPPPHPLPTTPKKRGGYFLPSPLYTPGKNPGYTTLALLAMAVTVAQTVALLCTIKGLSTREAGRGHATPHMPVETAKCRWLPPNG